MLRSLTGGRRRNFDSSPSALQSQEDDRYKMIQQVEEYLGRFSGVDGRGCMLRTLCEMAQVPEHEHGFLGERARAIRHKLIFLKKNFFKKTYSVSD